MLPNAAQWLMKSRSCQPNSPSHEQIRTSGEHSLASSKQVRPNDEQVCWQSAPDLGLTPSFTDWTLPVCQLQLPQILGMALFWQLG